MRFRGPTLLPLVLVNFNRYYLLCLAWKKVIPAVLRTTPTFHSRLPSARTSTIIMVVSDDPPPAVTATSASTPGVKSTPLLPEIRNGESGVAVAATTVVDGGVKRARLAGGRSPSNMPPLSEAELHPTVGEFPVDYAMHQTNRFAHLYK